MIVTKIGGSVLTDKTEYRKTNVEAIARLAAELAQAPRPLAVVHGAGSFGHVIAREHGLAEGRRETPDQDLAFTRVHEDVLDLRRLVVRSLHQAGVPAIGLGPLELALLDAGEVARFDADPVRHALERGLVPVLHGDVAYDRARGFGIVSGDQVMVELCRRLKPKRAVFASDVDGLLEPGPDAANPLLKEQVSAQDATAGAAKGADVTGGMAGKLRRMGECAELGTTTRLVNGTVPGRLLRALRGETVPGTEVKP